MNELSPDGPHTPVLLAEVLAALSPVDGGLYVDGTFGAGGYARAILDAADCRVIGIDRDGDAVAAGAEMVARYDGRLELVEGRFAEMDTILGERDAIPVNGVALDIGVSSMQIDDRERGFSFSHDGPLDMRMSRAGSMSAADVVNDTEEGDLARIIRTLGEERRARAIARAIAAARSERPITRTGALAEIIERTIGRPRGPRPIHPATRTFQALRIYVNGELDELATGLTAAERVLAPGGMLAVVTFHSLEDRIVKRFFTARAGNRPRPSRHQALPTDQGPAASFAVTRRAPVRPGEDEVAANPRARSAKLRVGERTDAPAWDSAPDGVARIETRRAP